jgi:hypothetical protein
MAESFEFRDADPLDMFDPSDLEPEATARIFWNVYSDLRPVDRFDQLAVEDRVAIAEALIIFLHRLREEGGV